MVINSKYRLNCHLNQLGFGLIELMVSISVMTLVTSVILVKHDSYNSATLLRSQAYDIALQLREVQLLSISAAQDGTGSATSFRNVYGVHFSMSANDSYFIFKDNTPNDYYYDASASISELFGKPGTLDTKFEIDAIHLVGSGTYTDPDQLSITFKRPNFDAKFYTAGGEVSDTVSAVEIDVRTKGTTATGNGNIRTVEITRTGQITVK